MIEGASGLINSRWKPIKPKNENTLLKEIYDSNKLSEIKLSINQ